MIRSFSPKENFSEMTKFQEGSGKSASFFFFTSNKQFVIKTLKEEELELLVRKGILEKYYNHIHKHSRSLLARFYGIYTIKIKYMQALNVIIMDNVMGQHVEQAFRVYDLKGSTFQRINSNPASDLSVRKDLNLLNDSEYRMQIHPRIQKDLLDRVVKDKEFLKACHLMDYSMLLIFFKKDDLTEDEEVMGDNSNDISRKMSVLMRKDENGNVIELQMSHDGEGDMTKRLKMDKSKND